METDHDANERNQLDYSYNNKSEEKQHHGNKHKTLVVMRIKNQIVTKKVLESSLEYSEKLEKRER